jgi:hypothetical protein
VKKEEFIEFVNDLKNKMPLFVAQMEDKNISGKYRFSYTGDIYGQSSHWGLGQSAFAARILYIYDVINEKQVESITNYINTFKHSNGSYYDECIAKSTFVNRLLKSIRYINLEFLTNKINKRAETRQALATLITLKKKIPEYLESNLKNINVKQYFENLDWDKPWGSGSHINHLIFFIKYSSVISENEKDAIYLEIEQYLNDLTQLDGFYNMHTKLSNSEKIGGIMKILMGLSLINKEQYFVKKSFIDFALDEMIACDACENFNTLYVLYYCNKHLDYRKEDIQNFALKEVSNWMSYYHSEFGAYSFYQGKAGNMYYGAKITKGLNEPDLHGSAMFAWGILVVAEILGLQEELGLKRPVL